MTQPWIRNRLLKLPASKALGCTVSISLFFAAYFWTLNHPLREVWDLPVSPVDRALPVLEWTAWLYFSLWLYICIPCSLIGSRRVLLHFGLGNLLLALTGLTVFLLFPTAVPDWEIDWAAYPTLAFLKSRDNSGNACPSLHVAFAVFAWGWLHCQLRNLDFPKSVKYLNTVWAISIILSTMTTKQHLLVDVLFGILLGGGVFLLNQGWMRHAGLNSPSDY